MKLTRTTSLETNPRGVPAVHIYVEGRYILALPYFTDETSMASAIAEALKRNQLSGHMYFNPNGEVDRLQVNQPYLGTSLPEEMLAVARDMNPNLKPGKDLNRASALLIKRVNKKFGTDFRFDKSKLRWG